MAASGVIRFTIKSGMFPLAIWHVKSVLRFIFDLYRLSGLFLSLIFSEVFEPEGVTEEKHIKDET